MFPFEAYFTGYIVLLILYILYQSSKIDMEQATEHQEISTAIQLKWLSQTRSGSESVQNW